MACFSRLSRDTNLNTLRQLGMNTNLYKDSLSLIESLRAISTARLQPLLTLHLQPINVVVSYGP